MDVAILQRRLLAVYDFSHTTQEFRGIAIRAAHALPQKSSQPSKGDGRLALTNGYFFDYLAGNDSNGMVIWKAIFLERL